MRVDKDQLNEYSKEELIEIIQLKNNIPPLYHDERLSMCQEITSLVWDYDRNHITISEKFSQKLVSSLNTRETSIHPDDRQRVYQELLDYRKRQDAFFIIAFRIMLANQSYEWVEFVGVIDSYDAIKQEFFLLGICKLSHHESETVEQLKVEKAKFKQLFDHFNAGVVLLDKQNTILDINNKFTELFGYTAIEAKGKNLDALITPDHRSDEGLKYTQQVINGESIEIETVRESKTGEQKDVFMNAFPINLESNQIGGYAIYYDISDRKAYERHIKYLSFHDELTGLYNRRYFENEIERLDESRQLPISIIMGDMDRLKVINDTYGHKAGDDYLQIIATILTDQLRNEDIVARVGGDEFAILLPNTPQSTSKDVCGRLLQGIEAYNQKNTLPIRLGLSLGCATKTTTTENLEKVFNAADKKMYEMKRNDE